jgi:hypothetical protein
MSRAGRAVRKTADDDAVPDFLPGRAAGLSPQLSETIPEVIDATCSRRAGARACVLLVGPALAGPCGRSRCRMNATRWLRVHRQAMSCERSAVRLRRGSANDRRASRRWPIIGGRPHGPSRRVLRLGASLHLFGRIIPALNLRVNWLRFPRAAPAPKMAAARPGHVFVLERHIAGNVWLVRSRTRAAARRACIPARSPGSRSSIRAARDAASPVASSGQRRRPHRALVLLAASA